MQNLVFEVEDRDGNVVQLTQSRWDLHIAVRHPEIMHYLSEIQEVIRNPAIITLDEGGAHHLSKRSAVGGRYSNTYLDVVVKYNEISGTLRGNVLTVFFNARSPKGELLWMEI